MGIAQRISARVPVNVRRRSATEIWETEHRLLHALGRARPPAAVQWMVTRSCDLHCEHCYAEAGRKSPRELTTAEAKRLVIDATADMGCPLLVLAGGELWLRRDIEELIEHAVARGLEWAMHTHGGHVPRHRELLRRHPPSLAAISLDGDRELHDRFRGKPGSHAAALAAVAVLVEAGCREVVLGTTVTRQNADHIADMFEQVRTSGAHSWGLHLVAPEGRAELELVPRPEQLRRLAAFARSRRARFPVELCNEWGSAGDHDAYYRDRPFLCGAGRISLVIDPTGEVMPCTTTDLRESEGNVRDTPLRSIWRDGFARFRGGAQEPVGPASCADGSECWLQTRNGVRIAEAAFGPAARPRPKLIDYVPTRLVALSHRTLAARGPDAGFASPTTRRAVTAAAVGLAFLGACTLQREPTDPDDAAQQPDRAGARAPDEAARQPTPTFEVGHVWPAGLDDAGLHRYAAWSDMFGAWKAAMLPGLIAWERGGAAPSLELPNMDRATEPVATFERELARYIARGFGNSTLADLLALLDAAERAGLFDAAFAAHVWRAAERVANPSNADSRVLEQRALLYGRLAHHQHVVDALVATAATLGPITQRAWLKKSAPPPGWRGLEVPPGFEQAAREQLELAQPGPWDSVGLSVRFVGDEPVTGYREGAPNRLASGRRHRWGRLDVMQFSSATTIELDGAIVIAAPAGAVLTHASLASSLDPAAVAQLDALIARALDGDGEAIAGLEGLLPIAHAHLRARLDAAPDAAGGPTLRTILVTYEE